MLSTGDHSWMKFAQNKAVYVIYSQKGCLIWLESQKKRILTFGCNTDDIKYYKMPAYIERSWGIKIAKVISKLYGEQKIEWEHFIWICQYRFLVKHITFTVHLDEISCFFPSKKSLISREMWLIYDRWWWLEHDLHIWKCKRGYLLMEIRGNVFK